MRGSRVRVRRRKRWWRRRRRRRRRRGEVVGRRSYSRSSEMQRNRTKAPLAVAQLFHHAT